MTPPLPPTTTWSRAVALVAVLAVAIATPFYASAFQAVVINAVLLATVGALSTQILFGFAHLLSLGHVAFISFAAMVTASMTTIHGWPTWTALVGVAVGSGVLGVIVGLPALRVRGIYLVLSTLSLHFITLYVHLKFEVEYFFAAGSIRVPRLSAMGFEFDSSFRWYWLLLGAALLATAFTSGLLRSRHGRAFLAIRESELAASAVGISVARTKLTAFCVSSVMLGVMGALSAFYFGSVSRESLQLEGVIVFYAMVIIGGTGANIVGPLIGAAFVTMVPHALDASVEPVLSNIPVIGDQLVRNQFQLRVMVYGVLIVAVLVLQPKGLMSLITSVRRRFASRRWSAA